MTQVEQFVHDQCTPPDTHGECAPKAATPSTDLIDNLYSLIVSSKFRRTALDADSAADIRRKATVCVGRGSPIKFSVPFGAYKSWRLRSYPDPDWAEVFNINYFLHYAVSIARVYEPGVCIQYSFNEDVMDVVSNIPPTDQQRFISIFRELLRHYEKQTSYNVSLRLVAINNFYNSHEEYRKELQDNYSYNLANWNTKYPEDVREYKLESARHNLVITGVRDLSSLSAVELAEAHLRSAMWCDAVDCLSKRREFNKYSDNIQVVLVRGPTLSLHLGTCETAGMHFWVGTGVAEQRLTRCLQRIVSQRQYDELESNGQVVTIPLANALSYLTPNLCRIPVWHNLMK